ncbi:amidase domain-containing protein [Streptomyces sp. NPDC047515]|uniref:amidase domain-containing protein n=1 Tax=Streptomyces sp. NPDC047515 TaxID=3155380 RepID=UPI0033D10539
MVTDPSQGRVSSEFTLKDAAGSPIPGLTLQPVWTDSGYRSAVQIPDGVLTDGATYYWNARACTTVGCSPWSAQQKLTVRVRPLPVPESKTLTLIDGKLAAASAATDCDAACPATPDGKILAGRADGHDWATWIKADLTSLPKGSFVTGAKLSLTRADCITGCTAQKFDLFQLAAAWSPSQSGNELLAAASDDSYASGEELTVTNLGPMVQSWAELGDNTGLLLRAADGAPGAAYYSAAVGDAAKRPQLTIQYVPPSAPGPVEDVAVGAGDKGLLARWNPPLTGGAAGEETGYTVKVETTDGLVVAEVETTVPRSVITGLDNSRAYRVAVTAHNTFGNGPVSRSALSQPAAVSGGPDLYKTYVQDYLEARGRIMTGGSLTAGDAAAESSHGAVFRDLLQAQEEGLVGAREALEQRGQSYSSASAELSDVLVRRGTNSADVIVHATVKESETVRTDGVDDKTEGSSDKRFTFTVKDGAVTLATEADDASAGLTLSPTAAAEAQVEPEGSEDADLPADDDGALDLDDNGFPVTYGVSRVATLASVVDGSGTANWAYKNRGTKWEYKQDCTNFVSKALYYGGHMKFRNGGRKADHSWWQEYWLFGSIKNKTYTWAGADNLRRHVTKYRHAKTISRAGSAQVGDVIFFKWKQESRYNHAAVVRANSRGELHLVQHGIKTLTTLSDVIARYKNKKNSIEKILIVRVKDR